MATEQLLLFIVAGVLLNLTPGPDVLYIVTHALRRGARAGVVAALGITAGCFVHIIAAALGVSALLAASATAFSVLKWAGAAYLVYVGIRLLTSQGAEFAINSESGDARVVRAGSLKGIFFQGFWTN
ncbi:MAG: LysE family translocator, partial [Polaromonas sp.]|nr:LysE family translocator [Polaromonas sp.]